MSLLGGHQIGWPPKSFYFSPLCFRDLRCSWQASSSDDNLVVNFSGDVKTWENSIEEIKTAKLGQSYERR